MGFRKIYHLNVNKVLLIFCRIVFTLKNINLLCLIVIDLRFDQWFNVCNRFIVLILGRGVWYYHQCHSKRERQVPRRFIVGKFGSLLLKVIDFVFWSVEGDLPRISHETGRGLAPRHVECEMWGQRVSPDHERHKRYAMHICFQRASFLKNIFSCDRWNRWIERNLFVTACSLSICQFFTGNNFMLSQYRELDINLKEFDEILVNL